MTKKARLKILRKLAKKWNYLKFKDAFSVIPDFSSANLITMNLAGYKRVLSMRTLELPRRYLIPVREFGLSHEENELIIKILKEAFRFHGEAIDSSDGVPGAISDRWAKEEKSCEEGALEERRRSLRLAAQRDVRFLEVELESGPGADPNFRNLHLRVYRASMTMDAQVRVIYGPDEKVAADDQEMAVWEGGEKIALAQPSDGPQLVWSFQKLHEVSAEEAEDAAVILKDRFQTMGFLIDGWSPPSRTPKIERAALLERLEGDADMRERLLSVQREAGYSPFALRQIVHLPEDDGVAPSERSPGECFHLRLGSAVAEIPFETERGEYLFSVRNIRGWFHIDGDGEPMDEEERAAIGRIFALTLEQDDRSCLPAAGYSLSAKEAAEMAARRVETAEKRLETLRRAAIKEEPGADSGIWGDCECIWVEVAGGIIQIRLTLTPGEPGEDGPIFHYSMASVRQWASAEAARTRKQEPYGDPYVPPQPVTAEERGLISLLLKRVMAEKDITFHEH